jgi:outer membrane murein-binding lipoprotein Lpp
MTRNSIQRHRWSARRKRAHAIIRPFPSYRTHRVIREMMLTRSLAAYLLLAGCIATAHAETYPPEVSRNIDKLQSRCARASNDPKAPACIEYKATLARTIPPAVQALMHQEEAVNEKCRNGPAPKLLPDGQYAPGSACAQREELMKAIHQHDWCWGHTDMDSYLPGWVICHPGEWQ